MFDIKLQQILSITTDNAVNMIKMVELMNDFDTGRKIGLLKIRVVTCEVFE